jgi:hypothetical protein
MSEPLPNLRVESFDTSEALKERLSTGLDVLGGLAIAAGVAWGLFSVLGPYAVAIGGVIVIVLNLLAGVSRNHVPEPVQPDEPVAPAPQPGPEHEGNVHISGR